MDLHLGIVAIRFGWEEAMEGAWLQEEKFVLLRYWLGVHLLAQSQMTNLKDPSIVLVSLRSVTVKQ